jgi:hypothetical protein
LVTDGNPLQQLIAIAVKNRALWHESSTQELTPLLTLPATSSISPFPQQVAATVYPNKESGGVAGLYAWLLGQSSFEVRFANDLAYEIHGLDAVAYNHATRRYLLCEAKGTTRKIKSPGSYLKRTKTKGRQLSWMWCWASIIDLAEHGPTADAFLTLLHPLILDNTVDRLLAVTRLHREPEGFTIQETRVWDEAALHRYPWIRQPYDWTKHRQWLEELHVV